MAGDRLPAGERVVAGERGATTIADRVVAKIAAQAAREALPTGVPEGGAPPHATVTVQRGIAYVRVGVELDYPSDIGEQCGAVRARVAQRVRALAGMDVPEVVVRVDRLHSVQARLTALGRVR
ncbi:Asp23/Gls24 family envelope stress response protein [Streptomyces sp. GMY02]|uniref:Asp23/Gls24 family envelope stress response protein n=1 Tax=Streptomyces sp. GMY02 TaxID=1333528 RepID=UPI001C2BFBE7|nr:Asp23/Gls24 family envelope stress response protein [Streptomyces sp. GMY02]QXE39459.1 Asp23/Gls24 family envelope stress response protein [Streptomyces sp. GMY02]